MRKFFGLLTLLSTLFIVNSGSVSAQQMQNNNLCWNAIMTTGAHFTFGDGKDTGVSVEFMGATPPGVGMYHDINGIGLVTCFFEGANCPENPDQTVDPHDIPGIATCIGCDNSGTAKPYSINQAKRCLITGSST